MRRVSALVLSGPSHIDYLKIRSLLDQIFQLSNTDLRYYIESESRFLPRFDAPGQIALNIFQTNARQTKLSFGNLFL